jgi:hypothetical protein
MEVLKIWLSFSIDDRCLPCSLPNVWELPHQDPHLHLDGGDVFQEDDLREVWDSTVQPGGGRFLKGREIERERERERGGIRTDPLNSTNEDTTV